jgi:hypothetical protein
VLAIAAAGMTHYYRAVTGSPFRMPYQVDRDRYAPARIFLWERPIPIPEYPDRAVHDFYVNWELPQFLAAKSLSGVLKVSFEKVLEFWLFFLGPALTLPLIFLPRILRDRRIRPLVIACGIGFAGLSLNTWFYPHYVAPLTGAVYAIVLQGMRHLRVWSLRGRPTGLPRAAGATLARAIPAVCVGIAVVRVALQPLAFYMPADWPMTWYYTRPGNVERARVQAELAAQPGRQLAIVHYGPNHNALEEWVYNRASIDAAPVVWARELDDASNRALVEYFHDRRAWRVDADTVPATISPY